MDELFNVLQKMDVGTIFIVIMSSQILAIPKVKEKLKAKFLVPLVLSILIAVALDYAKPIPDIINSAVKYAGTSMVIYEVWKNFMRRVKAKTLPPTEK